MLHVGHPQVGSPQWPSPGWQSALSTYLHSTHLCTRILSLQTTRTTQGLGSHLASSWTCSFHWLFSLFLRSSSSLLFVPMACQALPQDSSQLIRDVTNSLFRLLRPAGRLISLGILQADVSSGLHSCLAAPERLCSCHAKHGDIHRGPTTFE